MQGRGIQQLRSRTACADAAGALLSEGGGATPTETMGAGPAREARAFPEAQWVRWRQTRYRRETRKAPASPALVRGISGLPMWTSQNCAFGVSQAGCFPPAAVDGTGHNQRRWRFATP